MKDQHTKIKGYRDLSQLEIDLMNEIKSKGEDLSNLIEKVQTLRDEQFTKLQDLEIDRIDGIGQSEIADSQEALDNAQYNLKTGIMWLVRSVALPQSF